MNVEISLSNQHFQWKHVEFDEVIYSFKGDLFYKNKLLNAEEVVNVLSSFFLDVNRNNQNLKKFFEELNGNFAIIVNAPEEVICIVDRVRSIPLFYAEYKNYIIISDDTNYIEEKINPKLNEINAVEFLLAGYVTGNETLFEDIKQIQAGEFLVCNKKENILKIYYYYRFLHKDFFDLSEEELMGKLDKVLVNVFKRLIESTRDKGMQIVVPLSGGLDSRIIVAMLKRLGIEDVICFTYGEKNNREAKISKKVAEALGYKWYFVEYTRKKWYRCYHTTEMKNYQKYGSNLVSLPIIQDFLAVKELKDEGKLPENSVFVPGHTGDMISGGHIPINYGMLQDYNFEKFLKDNFKKHYNLWKWRDNKELKLFFKKKIKKGIGNIDIDDNESCANAIELFDVKERQAKYIVNSVRAYEFFGYKWRIPLWDSELMDFFMGIPIEYRVGKALYKKYAREKLFVGDLEDLRRIECTTEIWDKKTNVFVVINKIYDLFNRILDSYVDVRWGRYFKRPLISIFLIKVKDCNPEPIKNYPMLKLVIDFRNKRKSSISIGGYQTLTYLLHNREDMITRKDLGEKQNEDYIGR